LPRFPSHAVGDFARCTLRCIACGRSAEPADGWLVLHIRDPDEQDAKPEIVAYCPECAVRELGGLPLVGQAD
jgi:hypothetical protein